MAIRTLPFGSEWEDDKMLKTNTAVAPRIKLKEITPTLASRWLEKNTVNRSLSQSLIRKYASDMGQGRWDINGETIKLSLNGELLDGQHRLRACILVDKPFKSMVAMDLPTAAIKSVDIGRSRSFSDRLALEGTEKYRKSTAAMVRALWRYRNGILDPSHEQLAELYEKEREDVDRAVLLVNGLRGSVGGATPINVTAAGLVYILARAKNAAQAEAYVQQLIVGEYIGKEDPAFVVRTRILRAKADRQGLEMEDQVSAMIAGWNAMRKNRPLSKVYVYGKNKDEAVARWREMEVK